MHNNNFRSNVYVINWLRVMCLAILMMVFIGGLTRLTESGLSMTDWKPISGIIPPLNEMAWAKEFAKYKQTPEYIKVNIGMDLSEFKSIYLLEFIHRIAGRVTGLLYFIPLICFLYFGSIQNNKIKNYVLAGVLLIMQGLMGWIMVKSGLIDHPHVSPYKLGMHLILAAILYGVIFWQLMDASFEKILISSRININFIKKISILTIAILLIQIFLGALVAGFKAGLVYNSFPLMGSKFIPLELQNVNKINLNDPVFIQFIHRINAYILFFVTVILAINLIYTKHCKLIKAAIFIIIILIAQMILGVATLIYMVPINLALMHQIMAFMLLSCLLWAYFLIKNS